MLLELPRINIGKCYIAYVHIKFVCKFIYLADFDAIRSKTKYQNDIKILIELMKKKKKKKKIGLIFSRVFLP